MSLRRHREASRQHYLAQIQNIVEGEEAAWDTVQQARLACMRLLWWIITGALADREVRLQRRRAHRLYLTRPELLPNPRLSTPWQSLYDSQNDRAFITTMGFDVTGFDLLLESGFEERWSMCAIPRPDTNANGEPRSGRRSLNAPGALGLTLHYLNSTMREISLQQIFALIPSTVTRYLDFSLDILLEVLQRMPEASIRWPTHEEMGDYARLIGERHSMLATTMPTSSRTYGAFGSVDGFKSPIATSDDPEVENASYNGWLHSHVCNNVVAFNPRGEIIFARINAPGSWHDSRVALPLYIQLRDHTPDGFYLVADTAFPHVGDDLLGKIKVPLKSGQVLPDAQWEREALLDFSRQLISYRQTAEWGMRALQGGFGRLRLPLDASDINARRRLLECCLRLHQIRTRVVGINQIRNVYEPIWKEAEGEEVWAGFENMLFGDIRKRDRVSRFHVVPVEM